MSGKNKKTYIKHWQAVSLYLFCYDVFAVSLAFFAALLVRFDMRFSMIPSNYLYAWLKFAPFYAGFCIAVFVLLKLYQSIWRFASFTELNRITKATIVTGIFHILFITLLVQRMPISYYVFGIILQYMFVVGVRFSYRLLILIRSKKGTRDTANVMLIGAGAAGQMILRDTLRTNEVKETIVCIIDDNPNKWGRYIENVPIIGGRKAITQAVTEYDIDKIYIALPSVPNAEKRDIIDICNKTKCELKNLPGLYQLMRGDVTVNSLRSVDIEDLLGRDPVQLGSKEVQDFLYQKTILITGGGGSIGSELCRQAASVNGVKQLIIFDIYENNSHSIKLELNDTYPELDVVVLIGSVQNQHRVNQVFEQYRPDVVFHAAAHKHVPLMEDSPCEAIKNNVLGTYNTAYAAIKYDCKNFVLISTDKAVNPVNIMGASKRLCEMIIQTFAKMIEQGKVNEIPELLVPGSSSGSDETPDTVSTDPITEFVAVRFGNVLGSNGSVIPRFKEQIEKGGPVTVTHPDIIRYFMTIPEAASLVLQAATFGKKGKIFILDMGTPVKIADVAKNMIKLSGLVPDEDIKIIFTGLRPGEKLYEERLMDEENLETTENALIHIGQPIVFDETIFLKQLSELIRLAIEDRNDIRTFVQKMVSTYSPI